MPKVILEFNLPEEQVEFDLANAASKLSSTLYEFDQWLRSELKYGPSIEYTNKLKEEDALDIARSKLYEIMNEHEVASIVNS